MLRFASILESPTSLGLFLLISAGCSLVVYRHSKEKFYLVAYIINLVGIYLSGTRLALLLGLTMPILLCNKSRKKLLLGVGILIILFVSFGGSRFGINSGYFDSINSRINIWQQGITLFNSEHILFGHGPHKFQQYFDTVINIEIYQLERDPLIKVSNFHNEFLQILFNYGLIGLTFYLLLISGIISRLIKGDQLEQGIATILLLAIFFNQLNFHSASTLLIFCLLISQLSIPKKINKIVYVILFLVCLFALSTSVKDRKLRYNASELNIEKYPLAMVVNNFPSLNTDQQTELLDKLIDMKYQPEHVITELKLKTFAPERQKNALKLVNINKQNIDWLFEAAISSDCATFDQMYKTIISSYPSNEEQRRVYLKNFNHRDKLLENSKKICAEN